MLSRNSVIAILIVSGLAIAAVSASAQGRLQTSPRQGGTPAIGGITTAPAMNCVAGFNKTKEQKDNEGQTFLLECTTPTITCPTSQKYPQVLMKNELNYSDKPVQFRYTCTYFFPEG